MDRAAAFSDTAIFTICRFSGEGWDREAKGTVEGYKLSKQELHPTEMKPPADRTLRALLRVAARQ